MIFGLGFDYIIEIVLKAAFMCRFQTQKKRKGRLMLKHMYPIATARSLTTIKIIKGMD
jgi:hypothetical protein